MAENKAKLPKDASKELGYSGTLIFGGMITGEEYNNDLTGIRANRIYETMRRSDSTVRQALQIVKLPLLSTKWNVAPAKTFDDKIEEVAEEKQKFIYDQLFNGKVNFKNFIKSSLGCFDFGFSVFEKVLEAQQYEGQWMIGLAKLAHRKQRSIFQWETEDGEPGIYQMTGTQNASIPMDKLLVFSYDREGENYEGTSLLRYIYKDWDIKDKLVLINAMSLEKHGMGTPVITEKEGLTATPIDRQNAIAALSNMRANNKAYLELPQTLGVEMLDMKSGTVKEILPSINYHDGRIMTGVLARFMEIGGASGTGSQGLATDLSSIFMKAEEAMADEIVSIVNDLIKELCDLNYSDMSEGYPTLTYGAIADDDNAALATSIAALVTSGAMKPDIDLDNNLRERFRVPMMSEEVREHYYDALGDTVAEEASDDLPPKKTPPKDAPIAKAAEDAAGLKNEDDVQAAINEMRSNRNRLIASLSQG